ncbi:unnamed protein product [Paramecium pentaurelia]|nr:unnamed protein product [Paramecium pentaurelia]
MRHIIRPKSQQQKVLTNSSNTQYGSQNQGKFNLSNKYENLLDQLKVRQNQEMIDVLEEEQQLEFEREQAMANAKNPEEQKRLEKLFQIERNKTNQRLEQIKREHQRQQEEFRNQS